MAATHREDSKKFGKQKHIKITAEKPFHLSDERDDCFILRYVVLGRNQRGGSGDNNQETRIAGVLSSEVQSTNASCHGSLPAQTFGFSF